MVLSGTGSDGTIGVEEIKVAGGITLAQDEGSAKYPSMPRSAARSGCIDMVLPPAEIARALVRIGNSPLVTLTLDEHPEEDAAEVLLYRRILEILHESAGVDFSAYRESMIRRRVMRRVVLQKGGTLAGYVECLLRDPSEIEALYHDLLINVTSFFRDPETFEALKEVVFPEIMKGHDPNEPIRVWVAGCSTGQEPYSLAMVLLEFLQDRTPRPPIQIFATDLSDAVSLYRARQGLYPVSIESQVSPERLRRFFTREDEQYRINKAIREMCIFAKQNVAADPPFSHLRPHHLQEPADLPGRNPAEAGHPDVPLRVE